MVQATGLPTAPNLGCPSSASRATEAAAPQQAAAHRHTRTLQTAEVLPGSQACTANQPARPTAARCSRCSGLNQRSSTMRTPNVQGSTQKAGPDRPTGGRSDPGLVASGPSSRVQPAPSGGANPINRHSERVGPLAGDGQPGAAPNPGPTTPHIIIVTSRPPTAGSLSRGVFAVPGGFQRSAGAQRTVAARGPAGQKPPGIPGTASPGPICSTPSLSRKVSGYCCTEPLSGLRASITSW